MEGDIQKIKQVTSVACVRVESTQRQRSFEQINVKLVIQLMFTLRPPLWSSGQSFWLQIQRSRVRFPALPDFLSSSGSGAGSTQPREVS